MQSSRAVLTCLAVLSAGLTACGAAGSSSSAAVSVAASPAPSSAASLPAMSSSPSVSAVVFNGQDVTFSTDMIDHHRQAVAMALLAPKRTTTRAVLALAKAIDTAQAPEIAMMSSWLTGWGKPIPEDMGGMDMGGSMPGMLSMAQLDKLAAAKGAAFDKQFLTLMIAHHQGAVTMARTQIAKGSDARVVAMAKKVVTDQSAEIATMRAMLR